MYTDMKTNTILATAFIAALSFTATLTRAAVIHGVCPSPNSLASR